MLLLLLHVLGVWCAPAASGNKFGMGAYDMVPVEIQLPAVLNLTGTNGRVITLFSLLFDSNGTCRNNCLPTNTDIETLQQVYALGLRPIARLGQWPRSIRDFSDDAEHYNYTSLALAYRKFADALPRPPSGSLDVVLLNEPNECYEWQCKSGGKPLTQRHMAGEVASCLRDMMTALRSLPRMTLAIAPTAYTAPPNCSCDGTPNPKPDYTKATDLEFMAWMLQTVPDLYAQVDFFHSHSYPFADAPFNESLGYAGVVHYRDQVKATMRVNLPVIITETGWKSPTDDMLKAIYMTEAFQQVWLPDDVVVAVCPYLFTNKDADGWRWVVYSDDAQAPVFSPQYEAVRKLRCSLDIGGAAC